VIVIVSISSKLLKTVGLLAVRLDLAAEGQLGGWRNERRRRREGERNEQVARNTFELAVLILDILISHFPARNQNQSQCVGAFASPPSLSATFSCPTTQHASFGVAQFAGSHLTLPKVTIRHGRGEERRVRQLKRAETIGSTQRSKG